MTSTVEVAQEIEPSPPPVGWCQCGCGLATTIATRTDRRKGHVKGQPIRFAIAGHYWRIRPRPRSEISARFWGKVDRSGGQAACWPWMWYRDPAGYGRIGSGGKRGPAVLAHRIAWILTHGPLPPDKPHVRHVVCRTPACCNPAHLKPGTHKENMEDKMVDGTVAVGEQNGVSKLTTADVLEIRRLHSEERIGPSAIAHRFGVFHGTICAILTGRTWAHLKEAEASVA
jgi:hypothetical protein